MITFLLKIMWLSVAKCRHARIPHFPRCYNQVGWHLLDIALEVFFRLHHNCIYNRLNSIAGIIKGIFLCIGFFVIITKPPCIAVLWALHEAGLHIASVCEYSCSWTLHIVSWLLRQSEYHYRCRAGYHTGSAPNRKHKLDCRREILFQFCRIHSSPAQRA